MKLSGHAGNAGHDHARHDLLFILNMSHAKPLTFVKHIINCILSQGSRTQKKCCHDTCLTTCKLSQQVSARGDRQRGEQHGWLSSTVRHRQFELLPEVVPALQPLLLEGSIICQA